MYVIDTGSYLIGIFELGKRAEQVHLTACTLDCDDIGIHIGYVTDDTVKVTVAHMSVYLSAVLYAR